MNDEQRKAMFAKKKRVLTPEEKQLRADILESYKLTPKDKRKLEVIYYKNGNEIQESHLSFDRKTSNFESARKDLQKRLKNQKTNSHTVGWVRNGVTVYRDKTSDLQFDWLKKHPEQFEKFKKYGDQGTGYTARNTVFIVKHKDGTRTKYTKWGKPYLDD